MPEMKVKLAAVVDLTKRKQQNSRKNGMSFSDTSLQLEWLLDSRFFSLGISGGGGSSNLLW